jgi:hypothetical protein
MSTPPPTLSLPEALLAVLGAIGVPLLWLWVAFGTEGLLWLLGAGLFVGAVALVEPLGRWLGIAPGDLPRGWY